MVLAAAAPFFPSFLGSSYLQFDLALAVILHCGRRNIRGAQKAREDKDTGWKPAGGDVLAPHANDKHISTSTYSTQRMILISPMIMSVKRHDSYEFRGYGVVWQG